LAKTALKNAVKSVNTMLHKMAAYVNSVTNSVTAIQSAGFSATSNVRKEKTTPAQPLSLKIKGRPDNLQLLTPKIAGARSYCSVIFLGEPGTVLIKGNHISLPTDNVLIITEGKTRESLANVIAPGTKIGLQVLAQNSRRKSGFSPLVSIVVVR
jgi:hypothetical protein